MTTMTTCYYPFLTDPNHRALKLRYPNVPAPPSPCFDLAYPLISTLPPSNSFGDSKARSNEHLPDFVYDVSGLAPGSFIRRLLGLDSQDRGKAPAFASAETEMSSDWELGQVVADPIHDVACGSGSVVVDLQDFANYDLGTAPDFSSAETEMGDACAIDQDVTHPAVLYNTLQEFLFQSAENPDIVSGW